jgi:hypothetical protein
VNHQAAAMASGFFSKLLKPTEKENAHLTAAHAYNRLNNATRMFWSIECWSANATEESMAAKLNDLVAQKDNLNQDSPQVPPWAWAMAKERIANGEATYAVDKAKPSAPAATSAPTLPAPSVLDMLPPLSRSPSHSGWKSRFPSRNKKDD